MSDKVYLGQNVSDLDYDEKVSRISRVNLAVDSDHIYTSGDDTGRTLEASCPWGSQAMADSILSKVSGIDYQPYEASDVLLDQAAEIGDGITLGGVYSVLAQSSISLDKQCAANISAPYNDEIDDEYPYKTPEQRKSERQLAYARSLITKTAEEIRLEVSNELDGLSSSISVQLQSITSTVQGIDGRVTTVEQTASGLTSTVQGLNGQISTLKQTDSSLQSQITGINGNISTLQQTDSSLQSQITSANGSISTLDQKIDSISLSVSNGAYSSTISLTVDGVTVASKKIQFTGDIIFASDLTDGQTTISGDNILTGTIETARIKLSGKMKVYDDYDNIGGYIGYMAGADLSGSSTDGIAMKNGSNVIIATDSGARMTSSGAEVICVNNVSLNSDYSVVVDAVNFKSNVSLTVTSDRNLKDEILYDVTDKYLSLFDRLSPASFLYKGRAAGRHLGFIAQDVEVAAAECGIDKSDLALLVQDEDGLYGLSYSEFIPILVAKIKSLENRLEAFSA